MAVVQVYTASGPSGPTFASPDYLSWSDRSATSLVGSHVTLGHPEACLKKWSDGEVIDAFGTWVDTTAYILPGDSGSPVLDDRGRLVGLIHHSDESQDLFTTNGALVDSEGTASAPLHAAVSHPVLPSLRSPSQRPQRPTPSWPTILCISMAMPRLRWLVRRIQT